MKMNQKTIQDINADYTARSGYTKLNISDSLKGISIYNNNWEICELSELSEMIENLILLRDSIEEVTGIKF